MEEDALHGGGQGDEGDDLHSSFVGGTKKRGWSDRSTPFSLPCESASQGAAGAPSATGSESWSLACTDRPLRPSRSDFCFVRISGNGGAWLIRPWRGSRSDKRRKRAGQGEHLHHGSPFRQLPRSRPQVARRSRWSCRFGSRSHRKRGERVRGLQHMKRLLDILRTSY